MIAKTSEFVIKKLIFFCIYILHIKDNLYKFGKSSHLKNRLNIHKNKLQ